MLRLLIPIALAACAAPRPAPSSPTAATRFTVHIDTLVPERAAQFEAARRDWVGVLRAHGASDQRGRFYEVTGVGFITLRPLGKFAELDERGAARTAALAKVPPAALAAYDRISDESLAFPHTSEVWQIDDDLGYAPATGALDLATAPRIRMIVEDVRPDTASETAHRKAWETARAALAAAHSPLTRVTLRSVFGGGRIVSMWLARSDAELDGVPQIEDATVLHRAMHAVVPRPDLSSL